MNELPKKLPQHEADRVLNHSIFAQAIIDKATLEQASDNLPTWLICTGGGEFIDLPHIGIFGPLEEKQTYRQIVEITAKLIQNDKDQKA